jgi:hypothetical protein
MTSQPNQTQKSCEHRDCGCKVQPGQRYCSPYCEQAVRNTRDAHDGLCECGHNPCGER